MNHPTFEGGRGSMARPDGNNDGALSRFGNTGPAVTVIGGTTSGASAGTSAGAAGGGNVTVVPRDNIGRGNPRERDGFHNGAAPSGGNAVGFSQQPSAPPATTPPAAAPAPGYVRPAPVTGGATGYRPAMPVSEGGRGGRARPEPVESYRPAVPAPSGGDRNVSRPAAPAPPASVNMGGGHSGGGESRPAAAPAPSFRSGGGDSARPAAPSGNGHAGGGGRGPVREQ